MTKEQFDKIVNALTEDIIIGRSSHNVEALINLHANKGILIDEPIEINIDTKEVSQEVIKKLVGGYEIKLG